MLHQNLIPYTVIIYLKLDIMGNKLISVLAMRIILLIISFGHDNHVVEI